MTFAPVCDAGIRLPQFTLRTSARELLRDRALLALSSAPVE
jgi:hypothetical protein